MLTFNLKKEWFEKIKSGEKTHEYRGVKPYWEKRLFKNYKIYGMPSCNETDECEFVCGYAPKTDKDKRLKAIIKGIVIINGKHTDLAIDKDVYDIEFELVKE